MWRFAGVLPSAPVRDNSRPMLHCNIANAAYMRAARSPRMSKQLSLSAAISTFVTAAFVLMATPSMSGSNETGATSMPAAPAFQVVLPVR
jgi:hypothetical protein